jgi:adenosylcobinamide kinase / adenosylcobinamide-phosphate guanylyltransferase
MGFTFLVGGARSGKSTLALRLARESRRPVVFVATSEPRDEEMVERIERHRRERSPDWATVEAPLDLAGALGAAPEEACVVLDCLTLWTSNALEAGWSDGAVARAAEEVARLAAARISPTVVVSNEVGLGVVPDTPLGRRYRDLHGRVNAIFAEAAERACLVVAGRTLELR